MEWRIRKVVNTDFEPVLSLYREVAATPGLLAREEHEVHRKFLRRVFRDCSDAGLMLVVELSGTGEIIGAIHASYPDIASLRHVMGNLTVLLQERHRGTGHGRRLFEAFLTEVRGSLPFIRRVELRARASNGVALKLYESVGFVVEGRFPGRIRSATGALEDGIPMAWTRPDVEVPHMYSI